MFRRLNAVKFMYWIFEILLLGMVLVGLRSPRLVAHARPNRPQAAAPFFLLHDGDYYSLVPRIAVDNANGTHVAYHTFSNSANKVFYAYCASNCADSASWDAIVLGDPGYLGGDVQLALTPSGQPRMMWRLSPSSGPTQVQYAQCNTNCLNLASWTITTIASPEGWLPGEFGQSEYFALDRMGRPRFIYYDSGPIPPISYYAYCDSSCTSAANWSKVDLGSQSFSSAWLSFNSSNQPRVMFYLASGSFVDPDHLAYFECNSACTNAANWSSPVELYPINTNYWSRNGSAFSFHTNNSGLPRATYFAGDLGTNPASNTLFYIWCNSSCTSASNWSRSSVGVPSGNGDGPALAFDTSNRPRLLYKNDGSGTPPYSLGYGVCTANCETVSPSWQHSALDLAADIPLPAPIPPCTQNAWFMTGSNALALDSADNPRAAYDVSEVDGGPSCTTTEPQRLVRYTQALTLNNKIFLPILMK